MLENVGKCRKIGQKIDREIGRKGKENVGVTCGRGPQVSPFQKEDEQGYNTCDNERNETSINMTGVAKNVEISINRIGC